ncbi:MAG: Hsp70 family protein, partial [Bacteroidales bacterium]
MGEFSVNRSAPKCFGIDLGTSYTLVACIDPSDLSLSSGGILPVKMYPIAQHSPLEFEGSETSEMVASIVAVSESNRTYVGNKLNALKSDVSYLKDRNIFYHTKLDLGIDRKPLYSQAAIALDDASKIAGKILNYCRIQVVGKDSKWDNVVVTVPASFQQSQRRDTVSAMRYANIDLAGQMLIDEPNAAFLGYLNQLSLEDRAGLINDTSSNILVIDFGGGTTDLSTIRISRGGPMDLNVENIAISRYNDLGGQDIDMMIAERILLPQIVEKLSKEFSNSELTSHILPQLAVMGEKLKIDLCRTIGAAFYDPTKITGIEAYSSTLEKQTITCEGGVYDIDRVFLHGAEFQDMVALLFTNEEFGFAVTDKVLQSLPSVINNILGKSEWSRQDIDAVLLAGGSVQNPIFVNQLSKLLPGSKLLIPRRPDLLVAQGAAIYSFYKNVMGVNILNSILSEKVGVEIVGNVFYPLVEAGVSLPCKVSIPSFKLQRDLQSKIEVPFCINGLEERIACLEIDLPSFITPGDVISIDVEISIDKVISFSLLCNGVVLDGCIVERDVDSLGATPEQRTLNKKESEIEYLRKSNRRNQERVALREIIWEYYDVGNYKRSIASAEEFLNRFENNDVYVLNIIY